MSADFDIGIYEGPWTKAPNSGDCLAALVLPEGACPPAIGDVISVILEGKNPIDLKVTARTHLASDAGNPHHNAEWLKMWIFVDRI
jgi:hypothetical protein